MRTIVTALTIVVALATGLDAQTLTGGQHRVTIARGDTLRALGSRFGVDPATIARDNGQAIDTPLHVGDTRVIDNRHIVPVFPQDVTVLVNVPQRMLFVATAPDVTAYPVAVGRAGWPTPVGGFSIVSKETNPTWDVPESIREEARRAGTSLPRQVPPGPNNPLGAYWLGLSGGGIGIHGTNAPSSIYRAATHGCIRLHPSDIAALFAHVQVGVKGSLVYQPILVAAVGDEVFVEAHRDVYGLEPADALELVRARTRELGVFERVDWDRVATVIRERGGIAREVGS